MEKTAYENLTRKIIEILKNRECYEFTEIYFETNIKDITNNGWYNYIIFLKNVEKCLDIEISIKESRELYKKTVKDLIDCAAKIIDNNEELNKLIKENEEILRKTIEEKILNNMVIEKIRWSKEDRKSYKNPED